MRGSRKVASGSTISGVLRPMLVAEGTARPEGPATAGTTLVVNLAFSMSFCAIGTAGVRMTHYSDNRYN